MRLIDADAMRSGWLENGENEYVYDTNAVLESIDDQPAIDAEPVVHGRWETVPNREFIHGEIEIVGTAEMCTHCRHANKFFKKWFLRCPGCGAKMDEEDKR